MWLKERFSRAIARATYLDFQGLIYLCSIYTPSWVWNVAKYIQVNDKESQVAAPRQSKFHGQLVIWSQSRSGVSARPQ